MQSTLYSLTLLFSFAVVIPVIVGSIRFPHLGTSMRIMYAYTIISLIIGSLTAYLSYHGINNLFFYNAFTVLEWSMFSAAYYIHFKNKKIRFVIIATAVIFILVAFGGHKQNYVPYYKLLKMTEAFSLLGVTISSLLLLFTSYLRDSIIWISIGIFMYFSSSFLVLVSGSIAVTIHLTLEELTILWFLNSVFYSFLSILVAISFYTCSRTRTISR